MHFEVNLGHVALIAVLNFVLGWAWYSPVLFVKPWAKALGLKINRKMSEADKKKMPLLFGGAIFSSFALAYVLAVFVVTAQAADFAAGAVVGLLAWVGFAVTGSLGTAWEGRKGVVLLINVANYLVAYAVFGGILAAWH